MTDAPLAWSDATVLHDDRGLPAPGSNDYYEVQDYAMRPLVGDRVLAVWTEQPTWTFWGGGA